jgi:hypothetical protein
MMLETKNVTEWPSVTFLGESVVLPVKPNTFKMLLKYLWGDQYFYTLQCSTAT